MINGDTGKIEPAFNIYLSFDREIIHNIHVSFNVILERSQEKFNTGHEEQELEHTVPCSLLHSLHGSQIYSETLFKTRETSQLAELVSQWNDRGGQHQNADISLVKY